MIPPIYIDLSETIEEFMLSQSEVKALSRFVLDRIGQEYTRNWENQITSNLHQSKREYLSGIFTEQPDDFSLVFGLTPRQSKLAMMIEEGVGQFDMKEGFNQSFKKKPKKNGGWYLTIPFRHATPEAVAEASIFNTRMPIEVYKIAKTSPTPLTLGQLPPQYQRKQTSEVGYIHKAAIYEGLGRYNISSTNKENRGGYYTFRRVSDTSEENSWIHTGISAYNLMDKALNDTRIDFVTDKAIDDFLTQKMGK